MAAYLGQGQWRRWPPLLVQADLDALAQESKVHMSTFHAGPVAPVVHREVQWP